WSTAAGRNTVSTARPREMRHSAGRCAKCYVVDIGHQRALNPVRPGKEAGEVEPKPGDDKAHLPSPTLWPIGFAIGIVCVLVGLIVSWPAVAVGGAIVVLFGSLWVRDLSKGKSDAGPPPPPTPAVAAAGSASEMPE